MIPNLVIGAELRRVSREEYQRNLALLRLDEALRPFVVVVACIVDNHQDRLVRLFTQFLQKPDEAFEIHALGDETEAHVGAGRHRADEVEREASSTVLDDRRFADLAPSPSAACIASHGSLAGELHLRAALARVSRCSREVVRKVLVDFAWILAIRLTNQPLRTKPQGREQTADGTLAQLDAQFALDQRAQCLERPELERDWRPASIKKDPRLWR